MSLNDTKSQVLQGAINFMARVFPLLSEDKIFSAKCMWREQGSFQNQVNALAMLQAIPILFFKPGYTVAPLPEGVNPQYFNIDENLVWRSGFSA